MKNKPKSETNMSSSNTPEKSKTQPWNRGEIIAMSSVFVAAFGILVSVLLKENRQPSAELKVAPPNPMVGEKVDFSARKSQDPEGKPLTFIWSINDQEIKEIAKEQAQFTHIFEEPGDYKIMVKVSDGKHTSFDSSTITVRTNPIDSVSNLLYESFENRPPNTYLGSADDWINTLLFHAKSHDAKNEWIVTNMLFPATPSSGTNYLQVTGQRFGANAGEAIRTFQVKNNATEVTLSLFLKGSGDAINNSGRHKNDVFVRLCDAPMGIREQGIWIGSTPIGSAEIRFGAGGIVAEDHKILKDGISALLWKPNLIESDVKLLVPSYETITQSSAVPKNTPMHKKWFFIEITMKLGTGEVVYKVREAGEPSDAAIITRFNRNVPWESGNTWSLIIGSGSGRGWVDELRVTQKM